MGDHHAVNARRLSAEPARHWLSHIIAPHAAGASGHRGPAQPYPREPTIGTAPPASSSEPRSPGPASPDRGSRRACRPGCHQHQPASRRHRQKTGAVTPGDSATPGTTECRRDGRRRSRVRDYLVLTRPVVVAHLSIALRDHNRMRPSPSSTMGRGMSWYRFWYVLTDARLARLRISATPRLSIRSSGSIFWATFQVSHG
jgi:hypothetical protein